MNNTSFEERVKNHYLEERGEAYHLEKRKLSEELFPWVVRLRKEKFQSHVSAQDNVLEYGAGNGWNLMGLDCRSKSAYDLSSLNKSRMESAGIKFYSSEQEIPSSSFDVVICHHVLEHVPYPGTTLGVLKDFLKPGGKLILVVPLEGQTDNSFDVKEKEGHLYSWTAQTLANLVDRAGFGVKEVSIKWRGYDRFAAELAKKLKLGEMGFRFLRTLALTIKTDREIILVASKN